LPAPSKTTNALINKSHQLPIQVSLSESLFVFARAPILLLLSQSKLICGVFSKYLFVKLDVRAST